LAAQAGAATYDFSYTGGDIVASGSFSETGGSITVGSVSSITVQGTVQGVSLSFVPNTDLSRDIRFTGGTDIFAFDSAFPIDGYGPLFTTPLSPDGAHADWGFSFWSNGGSDYAAFAVLPSNIWDGSSMDGGGSLTVTPAPDGGMTLKMLGMAVAGLGLLRRKLHA
jgi:hypothetical protein